ncbi:MAG: DedA family protein [Thermoplasmata archaeon]
MVALNEIVQSDPTKIRMHKNWHYTLTTAVVVLAVAVMGILNGYIRFINISSYSHLNVSIPFPHLLGGYIGIFIIRLLPIPDFITLPVIGYLSSIGIFNPEIALLAALAGAVVPFEYFAGRYAARPVLLKSIKWAGVKEENIKIAEDWIISHGPFSIFISTFIPYFYSAVALAAGILRMKFIPYFLSTVAGFGIRYAILEAAGYYGVYILTPEYDFTHRNDLFAILLISLAVIAIYMIQSIRHLKRSKLTVDH